MKLDNLKIGFAITGSFCTFDKAVKQIENLVELGASVLPIMSTNSYETDTKFGDAKYFVDKIEQITQNKILHTLNEVEPIGPSGLTDIMVVLPCSGNTIGKIANGINDTPVTMAVKSHLRNENPLVIGISTNDALSTSAMNIGKLLNMKNIYFIPFNQDNPEKKPRSIVCKFDLTVPTIVEALGNKQLQPIIY